MEPRPQSHRTTTEEEEEWWSRQVVVVPADSVAFAQFFELHIPAKKGGFLLSEYFRTPPIGPYGPNGRNYLLFARVHVTQ